MSTIDAKRWLLFFSSIQNRRPAVIRQILTKRLSNSSLFWGLRYQILNYINVCPHLKTAEYDRQIEFLCRQNMLSQDSNRMVKLTKAGQLQKNAVLSGKTLKNPELFYHYRIYDLIKMIRLFIQVASESSWGNKRYYVVINDLECQLAIKQWLRRFNLQTLQTAVATALTSFLSHEDQMEAWIFCSQLAGHDVIPATRQQLSDQSGFTQSEIDCVSLDLTSRFALYLLKIGSPLSPLIQQFRSRNTLYEKSLSALTMYKKGVDIQQMAIKKNLKESTVREHLLNAAVFKTDFPYSLFLSAKKKRELSNKLPANIDEWEYRMVAEDLPEISFFDYRMYAIKRSHNELDDKKRTNKIS